MDPQKLSQLDPKLREAYQRVMGTVIPEPQAPAVQAQTPAPPTPPAPDSIPTPQPTTPAEQPAIPSPTEPIQPAAPEIRVTPITEPDIPPPQPPTQTANFDQMNSEAAIQTQTPAVKKKRVFMPILIVLGIVVFVVIYALIWTKIFNLKLPFFG